MGANAEIFGGEAGAKRAEDFRLRVVEHNVLVVAKYYTRVHTSRLAELLDLTPDEVGANRNVARSSRLSSFHSSSLRSRFSCHPPEH